jgi:hypothetical protein
VTRSKELRRIERAIKEKNASELRWALSFCELRKSFGANAKGPGIYRLEKRIRAALAEIEEGQA